MNVETITSMVVNGEKLEGERLRDYLQNMPKSDRQSLADDLKLLDALEADDRRANAELSEGGTLRPQMQLTCEPALR